MTEKERLLREVLELDEIRASRAQIVVLEETEPLTVGVPEAWKTFEDGTPQPDWTALIREDRDDGR